MTTCSSSDPLHSLTLERSHNESLTSTLEREQNSFVEFAAAQESRVKSNDTVGSSQIQTLNSLTLPTRCYAVEFNDESVTITPTK